MAVSCAASIFEQCDIGLGIGAHQLGLDHAAVGERHDDLGGLRDHMLVGEQIATLRVDDDARTGRTAPSRLLAGRLAITEEFAEQRMVVEGMRLDLRLSHAGDVHDRRPDLLHQRRERANLARLGVRVRWSGDAERNREQDGREQREREAHRSLHQILCPNVAIIGRTSSPKSRDATQAVTVARIPG